MQTPDRQSKLPHILLAVIIAILLINNFRLNNRLSNLENNINHIAFSQPMEIRNIQSSIWDISRRIDSVNEQIIQSTRLSFNENAQIQSFNSLTSSADVRVSFFLREHNPADTFTVTARGSTGETYTAAASFTNGQFIADMTLPLRNNYTISFTAMGETITTSELIQFNLEAMLNQRFSYHVGQGSSTTGDARNRLTHVTISPFFRNHTNGNTMLKANSLSLTIESDYAVLQYWDLTPYLITHGYYQVLQLDMGWLTIADGIASDTPRYNIPSIARLVITDNLGIRYERKDQLFFVLHTHDISGRHAVATMPMPVESWHHHGWYSGWGVVRIVD